MAYFEAANLKDSNGNVIDPAVQQPLYTSEPASNVSAQAVRVLAGSTDDQLVLLRRIVKILESQAAVDPQQRQRVTIDSITGSLTLSTITTVGTVTTVSTVSSVTNIAALNGWNQQMFADPARTSYNTGIRSQLIFT